MLAGGWPFVTKSIMGDLKNHPRIWGVSGDPGKARTYNLILKWVPPAGTFQAGRVLQGACPCKG